MSIVFFIYFLFLKSRNREERKGKERKGKKRKGKERKGKERKKMGEGNNMTEVKDG